MNVSMFSF